MYIGYIVVKRKKPTRSVEYVVYMQSTWHHKITILFHTFGVKYIHWDEVYTLGERDVIGTLNFSRPCNLTIMTLPAPNYDINMTSFPRHNYYDHNMSENCT